MELLVPLALATVIVLILLLAAAWVYIDAPNHEMSPLKWAAITFFIPFFGFFAYIFEREERTPNPAAERREEHFVDGAFEVHKSRADDAPWISDDKSAETGEQNTGEKNENER